MFAAHNLPGVEHGGHARQAMLDTLLSSAKPTSLMNQSVQAPFIGRSMTRREDRRLLTGRGQFIADFELPHMLHAVFVRSPLAHAHIKAIDLSRAVAMPGVVYALG